jgi:signal transduction histidine kinase/ActR/RegA family two-component response regulator
VPEGVLLLNPLGVVQLANPVAENYLAVLAPHRTDGPITHLGERPLPELLTSPPNGLWHKLTAQEYAYEAIARPIENSVVNMGWVLVIRDVTQERDVQRRVQQQERLAAVGQVAAGIAHDFNNILAVIILYAQIILRTADLSPHTQESLATIEKQAKRAAELVQQILDFSRQSVLERQLLNMLPFMKELIKLFERTLPEHIQIVFHYEEKPLFIHADSARIQQVMMNLVVNARDAMPDGGVLQIRLSHIHTSKVQGLPLGDLPPGNWLVIEVADSGSGISSAQLTQIFEPFFTTKQVGQGTGLGLAQVYGIVKQHEGYVDVASVTGQGSIFTLYFPSLDDPGQKTALLDQISLQVGHGQTILLIEDDVATRQVLLDCLLLMNYRVLEAMNARDGLRILDEKAAEIGLVLSDVVMPEMGGVALLNVLQHKKLNIPVVLLTGHSLSAEMDELMALGLAGWLPKPPDLVQLSQLLAWILQEDQSPGQPR